MSSPYFACLPYLACILCFGCAAVQSTSADGSRDSARTLAAGATYADLVRVIALATDSFESSESCLLGRGPAGFELKATIASSLNIVPPPPKDLDRAVQRSRRARLLSKIGFYGTAASDKIGLAALTHAPAAPNAFAVVLTDQGLYLRATDFDVGDAASAPRALDEAALSRALSAHGKLNLLFFTAEADLPLERVLQTLGVLEAYGSVVLSVVVGFGDESSPTRGVCPLENTNSGKALPSISARVLVAQEDFARCTKIAALNADGRIRVLSELRADGSVKAACLIEDQVHDDGLNECLLGALKVEGKAAPDSSQTQIVSIPVLPTTTSGPAALSRAVCAP